jgi:predicted Zn-dependent peptidase
MDLDIPTQRMAQNLFRNLYHHHPLRWEPVGTLASIKEISPEVLQQCYTTFYQPANMVVVLAGDLKPHEVIRELSACLADTNASARPPKALRLDSSGRNPHGQLHQSFPTGQVITRCFPDESPEIRESYQEIKMAVAQPQIMIGYKEQRTGLKGEALIKQDLQTEILLELLLGKASRLYYQLYDAGLINDRFSMGYSNHESYGFTMLGGECPEPEKLHQRLLEAVRHAQRTRFKQKDFQRIKRKYLGHWVRAFDSLHEASGLLVKYYINTLNPFDLPQYLKTISLKEINARLNEHLNEQYHSVSIVRPLN